jgi:hypothetical protein
MGKGGSAILAGFGTRHSRASCTTTSGAILLRSGGRWVAGNQRNSHEFDKFFERVLSVEATLLGAGFETRNSRNLQCLPGRF